jgi:ATP-dependent exoDNAse (exonuclease V) alpha subunit
MKSYSFFNQKISFDSNFVFSLVSFYMAKRKLEKFLEAADKSKKKKSPVSSISLETKHKEILSIPSGIPSDFVLTPEFSQTFEQLEHTTRHFYITGNAGTGKSTLLQYFKENTKKKIVVLAPTGIAAINIGGATIHSFFRFPFHFITPSDIKHMRDKEKLFSALDTLVIDEVSMVRADLMDAIDLSLRINRKKMDEPFGGVQVVLVGDLYQLPPIIDQELEEYFSDHYETPYFFSAKVFREVRLNTIELQTVFRQTDPAFIQLLNKVRNNILQIADLGALNKRHDPSCKFHEHDLAITLTSTNALASAMNLQRLMALRSHEFVYNADVQGDFDNKSFPTENKLRLKQGAQVMMVKNDPNKRWVNGSLGIIKRLTDETIEVSFGNIVHEVEPTTWEKLEYEYDRENNMIEPFVNGSFKQFPIKLAWAITIHKSQGKTFEKVIIDLGRGAFAHGQAYVALSRCRSLNGIYLQSPLRYRDIILDPRVQNFHIGA